MILRPLLVVVATLSLSVLPLHADIFRWDNGELIPGTEGIEPGPGVQLNQFDLEYAEFRVRDFTGASFEASNLRNARFTGHISHTTLTNANLSGAHVQAAWLNGTTSTGFTQEQLYSTASYESRDLREIQLGNNDLSGWDFSGQDLSNAILGNNLSDANLAGANLKGASLNGFSIQPVNLTNADLTGANLTDANFRRSNLTNANLAGANLTEADVRESNFTDADLTGAVLVRTKLHDVTSNGFTKEQFYSTASYQSKQLQGIALSNNDLSGWDFSGQNLRDARINNSSLNDAVFDGAVIARAVIEGLSETQLYSTASYRQKDLRGLQLGATDLTGWDFSGQDLSNATLGNNLSDANLAGANLTGATFRSRGTPSVFTLADFTGAIIRGADLSFAADNGFTATQLYSTGSYQARDLRGIQFHDNQALTDWDLSAQDLTNASISRFGPSTLTRVDFSHADLTRASLRGATFVDVNLSNAIVSGAQLQDVTGLTAEHLYSTASYARGDLTQIELADNDLSGWDFSGQDLSNANLRRTDLTNANLSDANLFGADLRDAIGFAPAESTIVRNTVLPTGEIEGLNLREGEHLLLSNARGNEDIAVKDELTVAEGATLEFDVVCTIGCNHGRLVPRSGVPISLGGTLRVSVPYEFYAFDGLRVHLFAWEEPLDPSNRFSNYELPAGNWDLSELYREGAIYVDGPYYRRDGDFDVDGDHTEHDLERLATAIRSGRDLSYDVNLDHVLDANDMSFWVHELANSYFGDANLDGEFNSGDLVAVFQAGHFEDGIAMNSSWAEGDWNGDGDFTSGDLVVAFQDGGYEVGPRVAAVPEPASVVMLITGLIGVSVVPRTRRARV